MKITKEYIREKLETNDEWLKKALVTVYNWATTEEQKGNPSNKLDGFGFNRIDRAVLNPIAESLAKGNDVSNEILQKIRPRVLKYSNQLYKISKMNPDFNEDDDSNE